jgi:hypothetical protein
MLVVTWTDLTADAEFEDPDTSTVVADGMIKVLREWYCTACGQAAFRRLDFGQLATVTSETDEHASGRMIKNRQL